MMMPSPPVRVIARLPLLRRLSMRLYNRLLLQFWPRHRVRTYFGAWMDCDVRDLIQATIIHLRAWEPKSSRVFEQLLKPGDLAIDIGANIGYFTLLFAHHVGPTGKVVAIEALPRFADRAQNHLRLNGIDNVRLVNAAVTGKRQKIAVHEAPATNQGMTTIRADKGFPAVATVDGLPITEILTPDELSRAKLIKIDIEGAEYPVMRDLTRALDRLSPDVSIAVEISEPQNPQWKAIFATMKSAGFRVFDLRNSYDWLELIDSGDSCPALLGELPDRQIDILFTKKALPAATLGPNVQ
jgi:FkbM family methyltransferase